MNNERRKLLQSVMDKLNDCQKDLASIRDEEQGSLKKLPEGLQVSVRGVSMANAVGEMDRGLASIQQALTSIGAAKK